MYEHELDGLPCEQACWRSEGSPAYPPSFGAIPLGDGQCFFRVWAPKVDRVELQLGQPLERTLAMTSVERGYHHITVDGVEPGTSYVYCLNGRKSLPDPASRFQPHGVHRPSQVVDPHFDWTDDKWTGLPLKDYIIYELHVGTFTPDGTFDTAIAYLDELKDVGITAIELMPVAQFPGSRNWGYDGVYPFAIQNSYGGSNSLKRLVDRCHRHDLAVVLDVVYNHLGPEGNYLDEFGHYFSDRYQTPWGRAINFDGPYSDDVRRFFIENALYWITEFHIDALRLDAVHAIFDQSASPFLRELADSVRQQGELLNRHVYTIAESDLNDSRIVQPKEIGGLGLDAQWVDDLHHAVHTATTMERSGYYEDFNGFHDVVRAYRRGFVYNGQYSRFRRRRHGDRSDDLPAQTFVVCSQNHDQVGNRMLGERLSQLVSYDQLKLAAGLVLLSPYLPLLLMGEEYGETAPFQFFISHGDPQLVEIVRRGRKAGFASFQWKDEPSDPQAEHTFENCKLNHNLRHQGHHAILREFYKTLINLRKGEAAFSVIAGNRMEIFSLSTEEVMVVRRWIHYHEALSIFHFGGTACTVSVPFPSGRWTKLLDSADVRWQGPGSSLKDEIVTSGEITLTLPPHSFVVFQRKGKQGGLMT